MRKLVPFRIAGKIRCKVADNGFKQITYLECNPHVDYKVVTQVYVNSLDAEVVCTLPFINAEINVISLRSKWQALPNKP